MTDELDQALRHTLRTAAQDAPAPDPGLLERVAARHRRRRQRRISTAAASMVIVLGATGAVGASLRSGDGASPAATKPKPQVSAAAFGKPVSIKKRWPGAVRSLPNTLPNGRTLRPIKMLNRTTMLGTTWSAFEVTDRVWVYDLATRKARAVTDVVVPPRSTNYAQVMPGTEGYQMVSWPWIGTPGEGDTGAKVGEVIFKSLRNVRTGERRSADLKRIKGAWTCGVSWCLGGPATGITYNGDDPPLTLQRRNGKDGQELPGVDSMTGPAGSGITLYDRFLSFTPPKTKARTFLLYDLDTGKLLDTGIDRRDSGDLASRDQSDPLYIVTVGGKSSLIDLSAIG